MGRSSKKSKSAPNPVLASLAERWERVHSALAAWPAKRWIKLVLILLIPLAVGWSLSRLENRVHAFAAYDRPLSLKWVELPPWLRLPENRHVLDSLARTLDLQSTDRMLDRSLAERLGTALADPGIGWVKSVDRVRIDPSGEVTIKCHFRMPAAWVQHRKVGYLVDAEGVRLPGRYDISDCRSTAMLVIEGVTGSPPEIGAPWPGDDLAGALNLVSLLDGKPFRHQITSVHVGNYRGRRDRSRPHIELATDLPGSRIWWGRPPGEDVGTEISADQKLILLETLYRQSGRIDMNRSYVDIMTWPDRVAMPKVMQAPAQSRLLRG